MSGFRQLATAGSRARVLVRSAGTDDAAPIAFVLAEAFAEFVSRYTPEAYAATTPTAHQVGQRMDEGPSWVVTSDDRIVGTVSAVQKDANSVYLRGMAVLPSARGRGVGDILLDAVDNFARNNKSQRLFLSTTPFLTAAIKLYQRRGFVRTADGPHELFGTPLFTMSRIPENLSAINERNIYVETQRTEHQPAPEDRAGGDVEGRRHHGRHQR